MNLPKLLLITSLLTFLTTAYSCQQPCILLSNTTNILTVSASSNLTLNQHPTSIISNLNKSMAIDVHVNQNLIFWSDVADKNIKRANSDGSSIKTIVQKTTGIIFGLAVEWNANLLYWTETGIHHTIKVARLDGSMKKVLIGDNLFEPRGIALDPQAGLMFWINSTRIESAYLNGEKRRTLITLSGSSSRPRDIALDYSSRKMYWSDDWNNKIAYADYNGSNHKYLKPSRGTHHFGVDIYSSWLYSTSSGAQLGLNQMDKMSGSLMGKTQVYGGVGQLVVMDISRQPSFSNPCKTNNGGCSHLCLLKPNGFTCQCSDGIILDSDGKTCQIKANNCSTFVPKPNTVALTACKTNISSKCSFKCRNGYSLLSGSTVVTCMSNGNWSSDGPTCVANNCSTFVPKPNTVALTTCKTNISSQCSFKCRNGYSLLSGSTVVTCMSNGNWSSDGPTCVDSQTPIFTSCPRNIIQYAGKDKTALVTWTSPQATDNSGKTPLVSKSSGPSSQAKLSEGVYRVSYTAVDQAKNSAHCSFTVTIKVIRCPVPAPVDKAQRQSCHTHYGGTCSFACPSRYDIKGSSKLHCQARGHWDTKPPKCVKKCTKPTPGENAQRRSCHTHYGGTCSFTCPSGYKMKGSPTLHCQAGGHWNTEPPKCENCFPASAKITLKTGDVIRMEDLKNGDEVQTLDPQTNEVMYTEVITFLHKDSRREMFLVIEGEDGTQLVISHKHLVYSGKTEELMKMNFADKVRTGDLILAHGMEIRVITVKIVNDSGIYAPMTRDGTMLVNGVYVSCYAHWSSHEISHLVMAPMRLWFDLSKVARYVVNFVGLSWLTNKEGLGDEMFEGLHVYADVLMKLVRYLPKGISDMYYT